MSSNASLVHSLSLDRSLMIDSTHFPQPQAPNTTTTAMTPNQPGQRYDIIIMVKGRLCALPMILRKFLKQCTHGQLRLIARSEISRCSCYIDWSEFNSFNSYHSIDHVQAVRVWAPPVDADLQRARTGRHNPYLWSRGTRSYIHTR